MPHIGVLSSSTTTLGRESVAALAASPAAEAEPPFQLGDKIVQLDDQPIHNYADLHASWAITPTNPCGLPSSGRRRAKEHAEN